MATHGFVNSHFLCQIALEKAIHCDHNVVITAPGLDIDKGAGVVGQVVFNFAPGDGPKDLGILGGMPGRFKLFCETTSEYYVSVNGLKIKKNEILITIDKVQPDGWYGSVHGYRWGGGGGAWTLGNLYYIYNHPLDAAAPVTIRITCHSGPDLNVGVKMNSASAHVGPVSDFVCDTPGQTYLFDVFATGLWSGDVFGTFGLGAYSFEAYKDGVTQGTKDVRQRGRIWASNTYIAVNSDQPFSNHFGQTLDSFSPEGISFAYDHSVYENWDGSDAFNGDDFTATGKYILVTPGPQHSDVYIKAFPPGGESPIVVIASHQRVNPP